MEIAKVKETLDASLIAGSKLLNTLFENVYASDLMSDVLAFGKPDSILLTGLATQQAVISAHMAEFKAVIFIRGKIPNDGSKNFANNQNLVLLSTKFDMFEACIKLDALLKNRSQITKNQEAEQKIEEILSSHDFVIKGDDFASAGSVSTELKSILKTIGIDPKLIRRIAISTYEAEMNVVMHAGNGEVNLTVTPELIKVIVNDEGKGIPNVDLALQKGFTTATDEMRAMGFGSGMGLPNIKKNSDELDIISEVNKGTRLELTFHLE